MQVLSGENKSPRFRSGASSSPIQKIQGSSKRNSKESPLNVKSYQKSLEDEFNKSMNMSLAEYSVKFKLYYETIPGEDLFVVGNIPELGKIEEKKHPLMWTEGHIWVSKEPLITHTSSFQYSHVMVGLKNTI